MGNCLKTQLKENVSNNNLEKLGVLRFKFKNNNVSSSTLITKKTGNTTKVYDINGTLLAQASGTQFNYQFALDTEYIIEMPDKYSFEQLFFSGEAGIEKLEMDIDNLKYSNFEDEASSPTLGIFYAGLSGHVSSVAQFTTNDTLIKFDDSSVIGTIEELINNKTDKSSITNISIQACPNITGSCVKISECPNVTLVNLYDSGVTYTTGLKAMLDVIAETRKTGSLQLFINNAQVNDAGLTHVNNIINFTNDGWVDATA